MKKITDFNSINELYLSWLNETDSVKQSRIKEEIRKSVSPYDFLKYSTCHAMPFEAFRNIFTLLDFFKTLEEMETRGEDISNITGKTLLIQGVEDIQALNQFSSAEATTKVGEQRIKFQGSNLFKFGDVQKIGEKFPNAYVNFIDLDQVEQIINEGKNYKGVPMIITIDNMGELPLDKLASIEERFNVMGVRIIEKDRHATIEQRPIGVEDYKKVRTVVDNDIINRLYVSENSPEYVVDAQLATQILYLICDIVRYAGNAKEKMKSISEAEMYSYYSDVSNITGLVTGESVCGGYAEIARNVLSCVYIDCKTMVGKTSSNSCHAWNQIKLGNTWFNTDVTWAVESIKNGTISGDLFVSDVAFFGDRRMATFNKGQRKNGKSIETQALIGGHTRAFNSNSKKCESCFPPYITTALIKNARVYKEAYEKKSAFAGSEGVVPYNGSTTEKRRSHTNSINIHPDKKEYVDL